jgi:hypothetical protein
MNIAVPTPCWLQLCAVLGSLASKWPVTTIACTVVYCDAADLYSRSVGKPATLHEVLRDFLSHPIKCCNTALEPWLNKYHFHHNAAMVPSLNHGHFHQNSAMVPSLNQSHFHQNAMLVPSLNQDYCHQHAVMVPCLNNTSTLLTTHRVH